MQHTDSGNDNENTVKRSATTTKTTHKDKKRSPFPVGMVTGDKKLPADAECYDVLPLPSEANVKGCKMHCESLYPPTIKGEMGRKDPDLAWKNISDHRQCRGTSTIKPGLCGCRDTRGC